MTRWQSLDALRGWAALLVVLYHAVGQMKADGGVIIPHIVAPLRVIASYGFIGVFLFFVISGFCIHLRWAKATAAGKIPDMAFWPFWKRRWRRLYPPYLIALAIYLGGAAIKGDIKYNSDFVYDLAMHLGMLHNLDKTTVYTMNSVFWTLAIEEQLYLAYFLLLFVRIRFGWTWALLMCGAARVGWQLFGIYWAPHYLGWNVPVNEASAMHWWTWALGALSVEGALGLVKLPRWSRSWQAGALLLATGFVWEYVLSQGKHYGADWYQFFWFLTQPTWGLAFFCVVNYLVDLERGWQLRNFWPGWIRGLATVGLFSYSLYLTHELVLMQDYRFWVLRQSHFFVAFVVLIPLSVACAWVFFYLAERPFMNPPKS